MAIYDFPKTRVSGSVPREQISVHDRGNLQSKIINLLRIIHVHTINVGTCACRFLVGGSLGSLLHSPRAALVCEADEGEVACGSLLRHDL